jgi:hypothetical protein
MKYINIEEYRPIQKTVQEACREVYNQRPYLRMWIRDMMKDKKITVATTEEKIDLVFNLSELDNPDVSSFIYFVDEDGLKFYNPPLVLIQYMEKFSTYLKAVAELPRRITYGAIKLGSTTFLNNRAD